MAKPQIMIRPLLALIGLLLAAWCQARLGARRTVQFGLGLFGLASLLALVATSAWQLIALRIVMGACAGIIQPLAMVLIFCVYSEGGRGLALGIYGLGIMVAPTLGPTIGGYLIDHFGWGAVFWLPLPLCLLALIGAQWLMPSVRDRNTPGVDLPAFMLLPWSAPSERDVPLEVWGPQGTRDMVRHLQQAFAYDIHIRRDVDERASAKGIEVIGRDVRESTVYDQGGVKITAFLVDHGPVTPAFGYRIDHAGHSVAISGDTRPSDNLVNFSKGVDVLIHEAIDEVSLKKFAPSERLFAAIIGHHTTPEQAADIFRRVSPRLAVFSHADGGAAVVERTRQTYPGRVEFGEDLMVIEIGEEVVVRRRGAASLP